MQINKTHMFRREPVPWYRSAPVCVIALLMLAALIFLGIVGVKVALGQTAYADFVWMPLMLLGGSGYLFAVICLRLFRRKWSEASP